MAQPSDGAEPAPGERVAHKDPPRITVALNAFGGETVLFGDPDMIAEILPELPRVDWAQSAWAGVETLLAIECDDHA